MKRVLLFLMTNLAVIIVLSLVTSLLGVNHWINEQGIDYYSLLIFASILGFGGAFISLLMSKSMAKWSVGAKVIQTPKTQEETWLLETVHKLADRASLPRPEVAIYEGNANAFATGATKSNSLVAVSTGLLRNMTRDEVEAVLGHEVAHIKNGDMVTLTLIQGVLNTFVFFMARVVGFVVDQALRKNSESSSSGVGVGYMLTVIVFEILFGVLASITVMYFSRQREFRADKGASDLLGSPKHMIAALQRLGSAKEGTLPKSMAAFGIVGGGSIKNLFASHPPLEDRVNALRNADNPVRM
ncbi:MAG: protease HtpX [Alphaproteobacteria bacterium]|nr:protease HtpX [Alphaproteobacteria bacterium]MCL2505900.1 protease HtpX [Alphaproteobacteria bacterium]